MTNSQNTYENLTTYLTTKTYDRPGELRLTLHISCKESHNTISWYREVLHWWC